MEKLVPPQCLVGSIELGHPLDKIGISGPQFSNFATILPHGTCLWYLVSLTTEIYVTL